MSMRRFPELRPVVWDALPVLLVAVLALGCGALFWGERAAPEELTVVVSIDGEEVDRFGLTELPDEDAAAIYSNNGYTLRVGLDYPAYPDMPCIRVTESDCPTQDCVHTGSISRGGQSIVCLPARIIIRLEGGAPSQGGPDLIIG